MDCWNVSEVESVKFLNRKTRTSKMFIKSWSASWFVRLYFIARLSTRSTAVSLQLRSDSTVFNFKRFYHWKYSVHRHCQAREYEISRPALLQQRFDVFFFKNYFIFNNLIESGTKISFYLSVFFWSREYNIFTSFLVE